MPIKTWMAGACLCIASAVAFAGPESDAQAVILLDSLNMEQVFNQTIEKSLEVQLQQNPELVPFKEVMQRFFQKYMSYQSIKSELVDIYSKAFTAQELKDLTDFYATSTGQKAISLMPELMLKGSALGTQRVQEHLPELRAMVTEEAARLKKSKATVKL